MGIEQADAPRHCRPPRPARKSGWRGASARGDGNAAICLPPPVQPMVALLDRSWQDLVGTDRTAVKWVEYQRGSAPCQLTRRVADPQTGSRHIKRLAKKSGRVVATAPTFCRPHTVRHRARRRIRATRTWTSNVRPAPLPGQYQTRGCSPLLCCAAQSLRKQPAPAPGAAAILPPNPSRSHSILLLTSIRARRAPVRLPARSDGGRRTGGLAAAARATSGTRKATRS